MENATKVHLGKKSNVCCTRSNKIIRASLTKHNEMRRRKWDVILSPYTFSYIRHAENKQIFVERVKWFRDLKCIVNFFFIRCIKFCLLVCLFPRDLAVPSWADAHPVTGPCPALPCCSDGCVEVGCLHAAVGLGSDVTYECTHHPAHWTVSLRQVKVRLTQGTLDAGGLLYVCQLNLMQIRTNWFEFKY